MAAGLGLREVDDLHAPAPPLGVAAVHAEQLGGEQRRLVAAGAGADLEHHVAGVVRVPGHQLDAQALFDLGEAPVELLALLARHLVKLVVLGQGGQHLAGLLALLLDALVVPVQLDHGTDVRQGLVGFGVGLVVAEHGRIGEALRQLLVRLLQQGELLDHGVSDLGDLRPSISDRPPAPPGARPPGELPPGRRWRPPACRPWAPGW